MNTVINMSHEVKLHPTVMKFLDSLHDNERKKCVANLNSLKDDPFDPRSGTDVKKLKGKFHTLYRLRSGDLRFEYFVEENIIWVVRAFRRGRGY